MIATLDFGLWTFDPVFPLPRPRAGTSCPLSMASVPALASVPANTLKCPGPEHFAALHPRVKGRNRLATARDSCESRARFQNSLAEARRNQHARFCPFGRTFALCRSCSRRGRGTSTSSTHGTSGRSFDRAASLRPICRAVGVWQVASEESGPVALAEDSARAADLHASRAHLCHACRPFRLCRVEPLLPRG